MSWSLYRTGTKAKVAEYVREAVAYPPAPNAEQMEAARALILSQIEALTEKVNGVIVEANGHADEMDATPRSLMIGVRGVNLAL